MLLALLLVVVACSAQPPFPVRGVQYAPGQYCGDGLPQYTLEGCDPGMRSVVQLSTLPSGSTTASPTASASTAPRSTSMRTVAIAVPVATVVGILLLAVITLALIGYRLQAN